MRIENRVSEDLSSESTIQRDALTSGTRPRPWGILRSRTTAAALIVLLLVTSLGVSVGAWALKRHADQLQGALAHDLQDAANHLTAGKAAVNLANTQNDPKPLLQATAEFDAARRDFHAAQQRIDGDTLLQQAESLPYARSYIEPRRAAVANLSRMGLALADAGQDGADVDAQLIRPGSQVQHGGARLIATLNAAAPFIGKITGDLERAKSFADRVDVKVLPSSQQASFVKARAQIQSGLDGTLEFQRLSPVLLEILGANGPRTYLVENLDPAELRAGGGFVGSYILASADKGDIKIGTSGSGGNVYDIDYPYPVKGMKTFVSPPNSLNEFATHGWVFGDSNFYADFPASARAGEDLFKRETGKTVDGVVGIDFWAVAEMLQLTGPIDVPEYNTKVDAKTFVDEVVHRLLTSANNVPGKKTFFPVVAARVLDKLTNIDSADWTNLLGHLNTAVTQRHMQVFFNNQQAQTEMANLGWGGQQLAPSPQREVVQEVEGNYGGNKANYWLQRTFNVNLELDGTNLTHHFGLTLKNSTPPGFEGGQFYRAYFRFYFPADASNARAGGLFADKYPSDEKPAGLRLLDGWYQMPAYQSYDRIAFDYTTQVPDLSTPHRIYWQKQPGTLADKVHVTFKVNGKSYSVDTDLTQDRVLVLSNEGVRVEPGIAGAAKLPVIS